MLSRRPSCGWPRPSSWSFGSRPLRLTRSCSRRGCTIRRDKHRTRARMLPKVPYLTWAGAVPLDRCPGNKVVSGTEAWLLAGCAYQKLTPRCFCRLLAWSIPPKDTRPCRRRCFQTFWRGRTVPNSGNNMRWSPTCWVARTFGCLVATRLCPATTNPKKISRRLRAAARKKRKSSMLPLLCRSRLSLRSSSIGLTRWQSMRSMAATLTPARRVAKCPRRKSAVC